MLNSFRFAFGFFLFVFFVFFLLHSITAMIAMKPDWIIKQSVAFIDLLWLVLSWITANNEVIESGPCLRSAHDSCCCCCCCCCWSTVVVVAPWINKIVSGCSPLLHQSTICKAPVTISPTLAVTVVAQLCPKYHQLIAKLLLKKNWKVRGGGGEWTGAFGSTVKRLLLRCNCSAVTNDAHWIDLFNVVWTLNCVFQTTLNRLVLLLQSAVNQRPSNQSWWMNSTVKLWGCKLSHVAFTNLIE